MGRRPRAATNARKCLLVASLAVVAMAMTTGCSSEEAQMGAVSVGAGAGGALGAPSSGSAAIGVATQPGGAISGRSAPSAGSGGVSATAGATSQGAAPGTSGNAGRMSGASGASTGGATAASEPTSGVAGGGSGSSGGNNGGSAGGAAGESGGVAGMSGGAAGKNGGAAAGKNGGGAAGKSAGAAGKSGGTAGTGGSSGGNSSLCPPGITQTITVAKDGSGQFSTVQAAVNSIPSGSSAHIRIDIKAGTYSEKLTIASRANLCMVGAGASTVLSYGDSSASSGSTSGSFSVLISADDFSAANLTIENTYGAGSQAVALRTTGKRQQFLNIRMVGYQDTLYTHNGSQYFKNCYVQGNTDYVFGGATAVLQNCEVRNVEGGSAVAAPNTAAETAYGIVFLGGKFTAASSVKASSVALGRPWGAAGFGGYLNVELGAHIIAAGFVPMSNNQPANARFHEFQSTGSGAKASSRASYQLTAQQAAAYTLSNIFPGWTPSYSQ